MSRTTDSLQEAANIIDRIKPSEGEVPHRAQNIIIFRSNMAKKWVTVAEGMTNYTEASNSFYNMLWFIIAKNMKDDEDRTTMFKDFLIRRNKARENYR